VLKRAFREGGVRSVFGHHIYVSFRLDEQSTFLEVSVENRRISTAKTRELQRSKQKNNARLLSSAHVGEVGVGGGGVYRGGGVVLVVFCIYVSFHLDEKSK
jgi:hypothetical protein